MSLKSRKWSFKSQLNGDPAIIRLSIQILFKRNVLNGESEGNEPFAGFYGAHISFNWQYKSENI